MPARRPPQPEQVLWHHMVPPSPHNGGWSVIMQCWRMLDYPTEMLCAEACIHGTDRESAAAAARERVHGRLWDGLVRHGEPPVQFMRAWLLDAGALYWWAHHDEPWVPRHAITLEATRALWREIFGKGDQLALAAPDDPPAGDDRRRAARRAIARRDLHGSETCHHA